MQSEVGYLILKWNCLGSVPSKGPISHIRLCFYVLKNDKSTSSSFVGKLRSGLTKIFMGYP